MACSGSSKTHLAFRFASRDRRGYGEKLQDAGCGLKPSPGNERGFDKIGINI